MDKNTPTETTVNVARLLKTQAEQNPYKKAVIYPTGREAGGRVAYTHLTFRQLDKESDCIAHGLRRVGIDRGMRTVLMVRPGLEFFALTFALFKVGAVPVVVDPGMGIGRMIRCLQHSRPEAFIGIELAHVVRLLNPGRFRGIKYWVTVGRKWGWTGSTLRSIRDLPWSPFPAAPTKQDETAAILFTTGSTGPAKGAVYTHGIFDAQVRHIRRHFEIGQDEVDLPTFPLFALFDPALGMTAVIPDMDPTRPAHADPQKIIEAISDHGVTNMFASPALLNRVGAFGRDHGIRLPSMKRVISAGAPVAASNIEQFSRMLCDGAKIHTPYGATEAVPVVSISGDEILTDTRKRSEQGYGTCVGRPLDGIEVRIIKITDEAIEQWDDDLQVADPEIGEIAVCGDVVTHKYFDDETADALHKIVDNGRIWHRMGDLGWRDKHDRIWFCGRKSQRVITAQGTLFTIPCEAIFNNHPAVFRSALVGIGDRPEQTPLICVELKKGKNYDQRSIRTELIEAAASNALTRDIKTVLFHPSFPVDIRHNAKIFREQLADWAAKKLARSKK